MEKALVLHIPRSYNFIRDNVLSFPDSLSNDNMLDLILQSFIVFLCEGHIEEYLWDIENLFDPDLEMDGLLEDDLLYKAYYSVSDVHPVSTDSGRTYFFIKDSGFEIYNKRLILRALGLSFWMFLRESVFMNEYELNDYIDSKFLSWINHLEDDYVEAFLAKDFKVDWFLMHMTDKCWYYTNYEAAMSLEDISHLEGDY